MSGTSQRSLAFRGSLVFPADDEESGVTFVDDGLLAAENGVITELALTADEVAEALARLGEGGVAVEQLPAGSFLHPGFIDLHVHAAQHQYAGTATDLPLLEWLQCYAFPAEKRFVEDAERARMVARGVVRRLLKNGTTTAVYFGVLGQASTRELVEACVDLGQRAFVGKVSMDRNGADGYEETTEDALREAESFVQWTRERCAVADGHRPLVEPVITPRFIPTCSAALLSGLGEIAKRLDVRVQSHISESRDEVAFVQSLHPGEGTDAEIFERHGLLRPGSVMAHGVYLGDADLSLLARQRTGVACCPLSNAFFAGADLAVQRARRAGVAVGLGTDVAGGYSPSMLSACRHAVIASRRLAWTVGDDARVDHRLAFRLATIEAARCLECDNIGTFRIGAAFDAVLANCVDAGNIDFSEERGLPALFETYINLGDDRNVQRVYVEGERRETVKMHGTAKHMETPSVRVPTG